MSAALVTPSKRPLKKRKIPSIMSRGRFEMKFKDFTLAGTNLIAAGGIDKVNLCDIAGGTLRNERIGNTINIKKIEIRGIADIPTEGAVDLMLWTPQNNADPIAGDFYSAIGSFPLETGRVLWSSTQMAGGINKNSALGDLPHGQGTRAVKYFGKYGWHPRWTNQAGTTTVRDKVYFILLNWSTNACTVYNYSIRVSYYD